MRNFRKFKIMPVKTPPQRRSAGTASADPSFAGTQTQPFFSTTATQQTSFLTEGTTSPFMFIQKTDGDESTPVSETVPPASDPAYAAFRDEVIHDACNKMAEIRQAAENGWIWPFENEDLLLGSEMIERGAAGANPLMDQRARVLADLLYRLARLIEAVQNGEHPVTFRVSSGGSNLASHTSNYYDTLHPEIPEPLAWMPQALLVDQSAYRYIRESPERLSVLPIVPLPWYAPVMPAACNAGPAPATERPAPRARYTPFWVHIPDIVNEPARADRLDRDYPRASDTILTTPPTGATRTEGRGDSFPLMEQGGQYFYLLNGRRIDVPGLQEQFPELGR